MSESSTAAHVDKRVLVTGANSGLGFETAAQLADLGFGSIVLACRSQEKADAAARDLIARTGREVFETLTVDVADVASSRRAAGELLQREEPFDVLALNAGMVPNELNRTAEGVEVCFGSSLLGHHLITSELIAAGRLAPGARVVLSGSEAANNDLLRVMGLHVAEAALAPIVDETAFKAAVLEIARGDQAAFNPSVQYATTKAVSAWWSGEMQRRHEGRFDFFTVSPGSNMGTDAARHVTGPFKMMVVLMNKVDHLVGMNQPVAEGARRYVEVIDATRNVEPGRTYSSKPTKLVGDLVVRGDAHLVDARRQALAVAVIDELIAAIDQRATAPSVEPVVEPHR